MEDDAGRQRQVGTARGRARRAAQGPSRASRAGAASRRFTASQSSADGRVRLRDGVARGRRRGGLHVVGRLGRAPADADPTGERRADGADRAGRDGVRLLGPGRQIEVGPRGAAVGRLERALAARQQHGEAAPDDRVARLALHRPRRDHAVERDRDPRDQAAHASTQPPRTPGARSSKPSSQEAALELLRDARGSARQLERRLRRAGRSPLTIARSPARPS